MTAIPPGSIKHKILEAILELGPAATGHAIRKRHPSNESIVNMAIDQLTAADLIEVTSEGAYRLTELARKAIMKHGQSITAAMAAIASQRKVTFEQLASSPKPAEMKPPVPRAKPWHAGIKAEPGPPPIRKSAALDPEAPPPQADTKLSAPQLPVDESPSAKCESPSAPPPITTQEPTVAKITCKTCGNDKPAGEFYPSTPTKCKACVLARQKELREGTGKPAQRGKRSKVMQRAAKASVATRSSAAAAGGEDLVIPAWGQITCRVVKVVSGCSYSMQQGDAMVFCSPDQLQAIRDWASAQLKARS